MAKLLLIGFSLVALFMGSVFGWIGWSSRRRAAEVAGLRPLDVLTVTEGEIGTAGYVEGRLSERNPQQYRNLVLYYRSSLRGFRSEGGTKRPVWKSVDKALPPLWIETSEGEVRIFGDYSVTFQGSDPTLITTEELQPGFTQRYEGLPFYHLVTAVGHVDEDGGRRGLKAEALASGTFEDYESDERGSAVFGLVAGAVLGLVGLVLLVVGITI